MSNLSHHPNTSNCQQGPLGSFRQPFYPGDSHHSDGDDAMKFHLPSQ